MTTPRWPRYAAAAFGFVWFLWICGASTLNPMNTTWMFTSDWRVHWLGFLYFQREPWAFPVGELSSLLYPMGTNIGYTDSNPLLSVLVKPFAGLLPAEYQLIGWWLASCFVLQGYAGAALSSAITKHAGQQMLGGFLFALSPALIARLGHDTLCAQWVLVAMLYLGLRDVPESPLHRRVLWLVTALVMFAAAVHPYLAAMAFVLAQAVLISFCRARILSIPRTAVWMIVSTLGLLAVWAAIGYFGGTPDGSGGFGHYPADLLTLFDSRGEYSRLLPHLPSFAAEWEGSAYLGAGGIVALAVALITLVRRPPVWRAGTGIIVAACVLLGVFALSSSITFAGAEVLNVEWLYEPLLPLVKSFRSSGRFIWAVHYLVLAFGLWGVTRVFGRERASAGTVLLAIAVVAQAADVKLDRWWLARKPEQQVAVAAFELARGHYRHLALAPAQVLGACGDPYQEDYVYRFMLLAHRLGLTFNSGISARLDVKKAQAACEVQNRAVDAGTPDPQTIYIASSTEIERFKAAGGAACGKWDGHWICVSRSSNARFATFIETGKDPGG